MLNELVFYPRSLTTSIVALCLAFVSSAVFAGVESDRFRQGDRIAIVGNVLAEQMRKYGYLETELKRRLPSYELTFRNFGWAGDALTERARPENFASETESLSVFKADCIIAFFGIGESFAGQAGLAAFRSNLRALIAEYRSHQYNGHSAPRLILITPMAIEPFGGHEPDPTEENRNLALYSQEIVNIAEMEGITCVDLFNPSLALIQETGASRLTSNGIVPSPYGYWVMGHLIADAVSPSVKATKLTVGGLKSIEAENASVSDFRKSGDEMHWKTTVSNWATPPPIGSILHRSLRVWQDRLIVKNLSPGTYTLKVDGRLLARGTHEQWSAGVALLGSHSQDKIEDFRRAVVDKNEQFFYSWRSLNQVHIVGERRKSPSGRSLPGEMDQFRALAKEGEDRTRRFPDTADERFWKFSKELN